MFTFVEKQDSVIANLAFVSQSQILWWKGFYQEPSPRAQKHMETLPSTESDSSTYPPSHLFCDMYG